MVEEAEAATIYTEILAQENNREKVTLDKSSSWSSTQDAGEDFSPNVCESLIYSYFLCTYFIYHVFTGFATHLHNKHRENVQ